MIDVSKLADDIAEAVAQASLAIQTVADVGTCNRDCAFIPVGKSHQLTRRSPRLETRLGSRAVAFAFHEARWSRGYHLFVPGTGQGAKNAVAAEAVYKYLRDRGWQCSLHYQID